MYLSRNRLGQRIFDGFVEHGQERKDKGEMEV